jgi:hypothetical protein
MTERRGVSLGVSFIADAVAAQPEDGVGGRMAKRSLKHF